MADFLHSYDVILHNYLLAQNMTMEGVWRGEGFVDGENVRSTECGGLVVK